MAYDEGLAARMREVYERIDGAVEKKMFGGMAFIVGGHMTCGTHEDALIARVGPDRDEAALAEPHAQVMDLTGRVMKGFVEVSPEGIAQDEDLEKWIRLSVTFVRELPPK